MNLFIDNCINLDGAKSAGPVEYADCIYAEG